MLPYAALLAFPPFALLVFRYLPKAHAAATVVLAGSMLLPERTAIDLPAIPPMDKEYITYLSALIAACVFQRRAIIRARPFRGLELAVLVMFFANIGTASMNSDPLMDEGKLEEGLGAWWLIAQTGDDLLTIAVPFLVGRALFTSLRDLYVFVGALVVAAVGYTGLIGIETVLSLPFLVFHLSDVVYNLPVIGHPNIRWGLTQPVVFFDNGLALASFMAVALIAASAMVKSKLPLPRFRRIPRFSTKLARHAITAGLVMTLNVAGNVYGLTFLTAYVWLRPRLIAILGVSLAALAVGYPALRMADAFPHRAIVEFAAEYNAERARSLSGRFDEEDHVLGQLGDRLWVGWGNIGRTPGAETFGVGEQGLDGWWTIRLGTAGVIGVLVYQMMLAVPVYRSWRRLGRIPEAGAILVGSLMCMLSIRMIDLLINGWWNCLPVFIAGVLSGVVGGLGRKT